MSNIDINKEFADFGKNIYIYAFLYILIGLLSSISYIAMVFLSLTLFMLIQLIFFCAWFVALFIIFRAAANIKKINSQLNNKNLEEFRSKYLLSYILLFIGALIGLIGLIFLRSFIIGLILSTLPIIIGAVIQRGAWKNLNTFFGENQYMFPGTIAIDAIEGTKKLRTAALCLALYFLIITAFLGLIFYLIGYFKLSHLRHLQTYPSQQPISQQIHTVTTAGIVKNFCFNCGTPLKGTENFCTQCGSKLEI